ncbi:cupin-like domain-containing protein [archaeon]|nr:MAG: cupin-like domain-containing protein [archaeon]
MKTYRQCRNFNIVRKYSLNVCQEVESTKDLDWIAIFDSQQPLVLKQIASSWPAVSFPDRRWDNIALLKSRISPSIIVNVEMGNSYMDAKVKRVPIPLQQFLDLLIHEEANPALLSELPKLYLAQNDLLCIPRLVDDIVTPSICKTGKGHLYSSQLWLNGIKGATSPCHQDPFNNILIQIYGHKRVLLFSPKDSSNLYPALDTLQKNTSRVDFDNIDYDRNPLLKDATGFEAVLSPGDGIFVPFKWWHFCKSLSKSCSVNFWWL